MSSQDKYYEYILGKKPKVTKSEEIVFSILEDLTDRRGLKQEWNGIDDEIKDEIIQKWIDITNDKIK